MIYPYRCGNCRHKAPPLCYCRSKPLSDSADNEQEEKRSRWQSIPRRSFQQVTTKAANIRVSIRGTANQLIRRTGPVLFQLPPEIRLRIYRLLLLIDPECGYFLCARTGTFLLQCKDSCHSTGPRWKCPVHKFDVHPTILQTCRQINEEAAPVLYEENRIEIFCPKYQTLGRYRERAIRPHEMARFTSVFVKLDGRRHDLASFLITNFPASKTVRNLLIEQPYSPEMFAKFLSGAGNVLNQVPTVTFLNTGDLRYQLLQFDGELEDEISSSFFTERNMRLVKEKCKLMYEDAISSEEVRLRHFFLENTVREKLRRPTRYDVRLREDENKGQSLEVSMTFELNEAAGGVKSGMMPSKSVDWFDSHDLDMM